MKFRHPFFISPHVVTRFQERIEKIPAADIIEFIQRFLQDPGPPVQLEYKSAQLIPIFSGHYNGRIFYLPVVKGEGEWPAVPTIYGADSAIHGHLIKNNGRNYIYVRKSRTL